MEQSVLEAQGGHHFKLLRAPCAGHCNANGAHALRQLRKGLLPCGVKGWPRMGLVVDSSIEL